MGNTKNEVWDLFKSLDENEEEFRSPEGIPFTYSITSLNIIIIYCIDSIGKYQKCQFTKNQFLDLSEILIINGNILDEKKQIRELQNKGFNKKIISFLFPLVYYVAGYFLDRNSEYRIKKSDEQVSIERSVEEKQLGDITLIDMSEKKQLDDDDIADLICCERVRFHPRMEAFYKYTSNEIRKEIDEVCRIFESKDIDIIELFLRQGNNKRLHGSKHKIDKIYINRHSSGHRLLWCRGEDVDSSRFQDEIIILDYVKDHDEQGKIAERIDLDVDYSRALLLANSLAEDSHNGFKDSIPPYQYKKGILLPVLSDEQANLLLIEPPALIMGGAGTGKTQISIYLFYQLYKKQEEPVYITFTDTLARNVREQLIEFGCLPDYVYAHVFSLQQYFLCIENAKNEKVNVVGFDDFRIWKYRNIIKKSDKNLKEVDAWIAWTYIRGVIKGGAIGINKRMVPKSEFITWIEKKEGFNDNQAVAIYELAERFDKYLQLNGICDDNDLAWKIIEGNSSLCNAPMIVDEIQDFTYLQIEAIKKISSSKSIYMCGDINQRINPTIIDLNAIGRIFFKSSKKEMSVYNLGCSFRIGEGIIRFVNELSDLRRKYIGKLDDQYEVSEQTARNSDEGLWVTSCNVNNIKLNEICLLADISSNTIILVPDAQTKNKIINLNINLSDRVSTISDAKGLEYDNVIAVNFISQYLETFNAVFNGEMRRNTYARLLFNMLYVACTRAREKLIIFEEHFESPICNKVYSNVIVKNSLEEIKRYTNLESDDEGWYSEGQRLEEVGDFRSALLSYKRIKEENVLSEIKRCELLLEFEKMKKGLNQIQDEDIYLLIDNLIINQDYKQAERVLYEIRSINEAVGQQLSSLLVRALYEQNKKVHSKYVKESINSKYWEDLSLQKVLSSICFDVSEKNTEIIRDMNEIVKNMEESNAAGTIF